MAYKNCPECDATISATAAKCKCGHRFETADEPAKQIRRCRTCSVTAEQEYERSGHMRYLKGHKEHWYCDDHNPQIRYSMEQFNKLVAEKRIPNARAA